MPSPGSLLKSLTAHLLGDDSPASQVSDSVHLPFPCPIFPLFSSKVCRALSGNILGLDGWGVWLTVQQSLCQYDKCRGSFCVGFMMIVGQRFVGQMLGGSNLIQFGQLCLEVKYLRVLFQLNRPEF